MMQTAAVLYGQDCTSIALADFIFSALDGDWQPTGATLFTQATQGYLSIVVVLIVMILPDTRSVLTLSPPCVALVLALAPVPWSGLWVAPPFALLFFFPPFFFLVSCRSR